jgi:hypothetical protein
MIDTNMDTSTTTAITIDACLNTSTTSAVTITPVLNGNLTITVGMNLLYYTVGNSVTVTDSVDSNNYFDGTIETYNCMTGVLKINSIQNINGTFTSSVVYNVLTNGLGSVMATVSPNLIFYAPGNPIILSDSTDPGNFLEGKIQTYVYATGALVVNQITATGTFGMPVIYNAALTMSPTISSTSLPLSVTVSDSLIYYVPGNPILLTDSVCPFNYLNATISSYTYGTGALVVNNISSSGAFIVNVVFDLTVTPTNSSIPLTIGTGLSAYNTPGNPVTIVDSTNSANYLNGYIQTYDSTTGQIVVDTIQNINGSFGSSVVYNVDLSIVLGGKITIPIPAGLTFYTGQSVYVSSSTNSNNSFAGIVEEYGFGTGLLTISSLQNITGAFVDTVIYIVSLSTPFPIYPTQAYKSVYVPIQPAPPQPYPDYTNVINYASDQATYPSANYGYKKFGFNSRTSLNNPVRGFSLGHATCFTNNFCLARK